MGRKPAPPQLSLFQERPPPAPELPFTSERELAASLPAHVKFGTSSWTFPGWRGLVYPREVSAETIQERGLELYSRHPLLQTVGIDRSYYRPLTDSELVDYARQLPAGFECVIKAWSAITTAVDARSRSPNPLYLDNDRFCTEVLGPLQRSFAAHLGPIVFEFPPLRPLELPTSAEFARSLDRFFSALPRGPRYAVELRNSELLGPGYLDVLAAHGVSHVLNFWERMPTLRRQWAGSNKLPADFVVCRLLIPPGERYEERRAALAPFDRIAQEEPAMRDDVVEISQACAALGKVLFVIVNNKAEGSSPLTVRALAERLARGGSP